MLSSGIIARKTAQLNNSNALLAPSNPAVPADEEPLFTPVNNTFASVNSFIDVTYHLFYVLSLTHEQLSSLDTLMTSNVESHQSLSDKLDIVYSHFTEAQKLTAQRNQIIDRDKNHQQTSIDNVKALFAMLIQAKINNATSMKSQLANENNKISRLIASNAMIATLCDENPEKLDVIIDKQQHMMEAARLKIQLLRDTLKLLEGTTPPSAPPPEAPINILANASAPSSIYGDYSDEKESISSPPGGPAFGPVKPASQTRKSSVDSVSAPPKNSKLIERDSPSISRNAREVVHIEQKIASEFTRGKNGEKLETAFKLVKDDQSPEFCKHIMRTHDLAWINVLNPTVKLQDGIWECGEVQLLVSHLGVRPLDETLTVRFDLNALRSQYATCIALSLLSSNPNKTVVVNFDHALGYGYHLLELYGKALENAGAKVDTAKSRFLSESISNIGNQFGAEFRLPRLHDTYAKLSPLLPQYQANNSVKPSSPPKLKDDLAFLEKTVVKDQKSVEALGNFTSNKKDDCIEFTSPKGVFTAAQNNAFTHCSKDNCEQSIEGLIYVYLKSIEGKVISNHLVTLSEASQEVQSRVEKALARKINTPGNEHALINGKTLGEVLSFDSHQTKRLDLGFIDKNAKNKSKELSPAICEFKCTIM